MKWLVLLLLVGAASAESYDDDFGKESDEFSSGLEKAPNHGELSNEHLERVKFRKNLEEGHRIQKRSKWITTISEAACKLSPYVTSGWTKNQIIDWINENLEPILRGVLIEVVKKGMPLLKIYLKKVCRKTRSQSSDSLMKAPPQSSDSLMKLWHKIREFFQLLGLEPQEKFFIFVEWVRTTIKANLEQVQDKLERIRFLAREVINNSQSMPAIAAGQALVFFQAYESDLGPPLWKDFSVAMWKVISTES